MSRQLFVAALLATSALTGCGPETSDDTSPTGTRPPGSPTEAETAAPTPTGLPGTPTGLPEESDPPNTPTEDGGTEPSTGTPSQTPTETQTPPPGTSTQTPTATAPLGILEDCSDTHRTFFAWDLAVMPPATIEVEATCRLVGPAAYLYVADDQWGNTVDASLARSFMSTIEISVGGAAQRPELGIIDNNREVFGEFPDALDGDPRIYLLLLDLADFVNADGQVFRFDGYFNAYDELPDDTVKRVTQGLYRSNEVEMLYLNSRIRQATDPYTLAVAAHEMQHLIAYNYDTSEELWLGESLAEIAMLINGFYTDEPWVQRYASQPEQPLVTGSAGGSYGAWLLFGMYLYEQLGEAFIGQLQAQSADGIDGINRALRQAGETTDFDSLFADWIVANALNDNREGPNRFSYGFTPELPEMARVSTLLSGGDTYDGEVLAYAVDYLDVWPDEQGQLVVTGQGAGLTVRVVVYESFGGIQVLTLDPSPAGRSLAVSPQNTYLLVVSHLDDREVDTGVTVSYSAKLQ